MVKLESLFTNFKLSRFLLILGMCGFVGVSAVFNLDIFNLLIGLILGVFLYYLIVLPHEFYSACTINEEKFSIFELICGFLLQLSLIVILYETKHLIILGLLVALMVGILSLVKAYKPKGNI